MSQGHRLLTLVLASGILLFPLSTAVAETVLAQYTFDAGVNCVNQGWVAVDNSGHGIWAALFKGNTQVQQDPVPNLTCMWAFINFSTETYACGGFPLQKAVPKSNALSQYVDNEVRSPSIPLIGAGTHVSVEFDIYEDLALDNLVFYKWGIRFFVGGVWGAWNTDGVSWYGDTNEWGRFVSMAPAIPAGATAVQVALGCVDHCDMWCGVLGTGSCHSHAPLFDNVKVTRVDGEPEILSITDVGNDQGRRVRIKWKRAASDAGINSNPVTGYGIYRRQDAFLTTGQSSGAVRAAMQPGANPVLLAAGWDYVTTVPARNLAFPNPDEWMPDEEHVFPTYQTLVETLCDSTEADGQCWSVFMVSAETGDPGVFYDSDPDSGYSIDNLSPPAPGGFTVAYNVPGGNQLEWAESSAPDFRHFNIYRTGGTSRAIASGSLVHTTNATQWQDATGTTEHQYTISAVDDAGNEGPESAPVATTGIDGKTPSSFALHAGFPNPFVSSTRVRYEVPRGGGAVTLRIYDTAGRVVAKLREGFESEGEKSVVWNGLDGAGHPVASGVYFCRMTAAGYSRTQKLILTR